MKKLFLVLLLLLPLCAAKAEAVDPFQEMTVNAAAETASPEQPIALRGVDFGTGASLLRFKAVSDSQLTIRVYADVPEGEPVATALFRSVTK